VSPLGGAGHEDRLGADAAERRQAQRVAHEPEAYALRRTREATTIHAVARHPERAPLDERGESLTLVIKPPARQRVQGEGRPAPALARDVR